jgi:hypothetical protein
LSRAGEVETRRMVALKPENHGVGGSIPPLGTIPSPTDRPEINCIRAVYPDACASSGE